MLPVPLAAQVLPALPAQVQLQVSDAGKVSTTRASNTVSGPALLAVMVYTTLPPGKAVATPSELVIDRSTSCAVRISQPKSAGGAPPKLVSVPTGLFESNEPAAVVTKYWSVLVPRSGGEKMPRARLSSCAAVAPVVPPLLSNAMPAQIARAPKNERAARLDGAHDAGREHGRVVRSRLDERARPAARTVGKVETHQRTRRHVDGIQVRDDEAKAVDRIGRRADQVEVVGGQARDRIEDLLRGAARGERLVPERPQVGIHRVGAGGPEELRFSHGRRQRHAAHPLHVATGLVEYLCLRRRADGAGNDHRACQQREAPRHGAPPSVGSYHCPGVAVGERRGRAGRLAPRATRRHPKGKRRRIGNPTPRRVIARSVARLDLPGAMGSGDGQRWSRGPGRLGRHALDSWSEFVARVKRQRARVQRTPPRFGYPALPSIRSRDRTGQYRMAYSANAADHRMPDATTLAR